jgi:hypothetical protein
MPYALNCRSKSMVTAASAAVTQLGLLGRNFLWFVSFGAPGALTLRRG